jgi:hypothetical protein
MIAMKYETLWSIHDLPSATSSSTVFIWIAIISACLIGATAVFKKTLLKADADIGVIQFGLISFLLIGLTGSIYIQFFTDINEFEEREKILRSSHKIEGRVHSHKISFRNTRLGSAENESFSIDTVSFYFSNELLSRFNTFSKTNAGLAHDGSYLRITYAPEGLGFTRKNAILKIERIKNPEKKFPMLIDIGSSQ